MASSRSRLISPCTPPGLPLRSSSPLSPHESPPESPSPTLVLARHSARLTSSPASSPHIVEALNRTRSVRPEMAVTNPMYSGVSPGADFFDDSSLNSVQEDDGEDDWEDDNGTRLFSELEGWGVFDDSDGDVGAIDDSNALHGFPPLGQSSIFNSSSALSGSQLPSHSPTDDEDQGGEDGNEEGRPARRVTKQARQMSLRRLGKVRLVQNHTFLSSAGGTSRESLLLDSVDVSDVPSPLTLRGDGAKTRHRRNSSESMAAVLQNHAITMRALDFLSPSASVSTTRAHRARDDSGLGLSPANTSPRHQWRTNIASMASDDDPDRPRNLPSHFIKTPYPFTLHKEFPKPQTRPRPHSDAQAKYGGLEAKRDGDLDHSGHRLMTQKHRWALVASDGEIDLRSKFARGTRGYTDRRTHNFGVKRTQSESGRRKRGWSSSSSTSKGGSSRESAVLVSLRHRRGEGGVVNKLEKICIPASLTTSSPDPKSKKRGNEGSEIKNRSDDDAVVDFDDKFFAERLRAAYASLSGSWFHHTFPARKLRYIQLGGVSAWSGCPSLETYDCTSSTVTQLLAAGAGLDINDATHSPFTERKLMDLYRNPASGKARYTWVHWARRVAARNGSFEALSSTLSTRSRKTDNVEDEAQKVPTTPRSSPSHPHASSIPFVLTTIQFVHSWSVLRIGVVLGLMLASSVLAAVLWIFLGVSGWAHLVAEGQGERVGPGMLLGLLVLVFEGVIFLAWLGFSWKGPR